MCNMLLCSVFSCLYDVHIVCNMLLFSVVFMMFTLCVICCCFQYADDVLNCFLSYKLDDVKMSQRKMEDRLSYFAKYLTSEKVSYFYSLAM